MTDLYGQYCKIKTEVDAAMQRVVDRSEFVNGAPVREFADALASYTGARHVIPCANGTDALRLALMALDLQPGDEVITVPFTFVSTLEVIVLLGLKPILVDVCPDTFNMDVSQLESVITPDGTFRAQETDTSIFIYPPYRIQSADMLLTNFHLPKSTLLMLVSAFAGFDLVMEAYRFAIRERMRFFSYGDCMLILNRI